MMNKLSEIPDKNPFNVPENYFEDVKRKIISSNSGYKQEVKKALPNIKLRSYLTIAASVAGFILLGYFTIMLLIPDKTRFRISKVNYEEFQELYVNDIDILILEENPASLLPSDKVPDISKKELIDYLLVENIEINEIYEHL
jgi:hypothetical protein